MRISQVRILSGQFKIQFRGVSEWSNVSALNTDDRDERSVGSNPTPSVLSRA